MLRYLGYKKGNLSPEISLMVDECIDECRKISKPKKVWRMFDIIGNGGELMLSGTELLLPGKDLKYYIAKAGKCAVLAATLGLAVDTKILELQHTDLAKAVVFDASATALVEKLCDEISDEVEKQVSNEGLFTGYRYSPGYGDTPLDIQRKILDILNAGRLIGLYANESCILTPRKSVTAFIGIFNEKISAGGCEICSRRNSCTYRKEGKICGV
ncbi:MAG: vitamin B12 dependent-methionine synthase activation domain-containing protein [Bacillota bacterium]|nr:vitamin B12 dependent-methionine synthase activation domain-containing protein [Bacillota bacterium]